MRISASNSHPGQTDLLRDTLAQLGLYIRLEKKFFGILLSYALAIGLFALIIPLTVQELVNTFAYAIQPIMIVTLSGIMLVALLTIGVFRELQVRAMENHAQRLFARIAVALTQQLPRFREESFHPKYANYFLEADMVNRSFPAILVDLINVVIGGVFGMALLVMYHPYFFGFNLLMVGGFLAVFVMLGYGAFRRTLTESALKYETLNWLQDVADNLLYFKATASTPLLLRKTDDLVGAYVAARKVRTEILTGHVLRGSLIWGAFCYSGLIATAGWLLSIGQITLGQFVASEVVVGGLLVNFDLVSRRLWAIIYVFVSLRVLAFLFSLPKDAEPEKMGVPLPDPAIHGIRLTCKDLSFSYPDAAPVFQNFDLEVAPGEKVAIFTETSSGKTALALILAGISQPTAGVIRYNGVDLRDLGLESLNTCRGLVLGSQLSLFEGTLEENITMGRASIPHEDVRWALRFVELEDEVDAMPLGLKTPASARGRTFTTGQILRILTARAIVTRPQVLIFDGTLHSMQPSTRETILRRLCSKEEPWSVIFISNDASVSVHVDRRLMLD